MAIEDACDVLLLCGVLLYKPLADNLDIAS